MNGRGRRKLQLGKKGSDVCKEGDRARVQLKGREGRGWDEGPHFGNSLSPRKGTHLMKVEVFKGEKIFFQFKDFRLDDKRESSIR